MNNHRVDVIRISEVLVHTNADSLEIIPVGGFQAVVRKGDYKVGDLAYYIPPDSIVPDRPEFAFLWNDATFEGGTPERKRRIAAKKLRKEWSEGLLMPTKKLGGFDVVTFGAGDGTFMFIEVGTDVATFLGITHYNPPEPGENTQPGSNEGNLKKRRLPRTFRGWVSLIKSWLHGERREGGVSLPTYDVDNFKHYANTFEPGDNVVVTEKIHGSNARYVYKPGILGFKGRMYAGSRNLWKAPGSSCAWRKALKDQPWIEFWCTQHPNFALYGEITPTQTGFDYGATDGRVFFHLFDIRSPEGKWLTHDECEDMFYAPGIARWYNEVSVPLLYRGPFNLAAIKSLVDGQSVIGGAKHIREGVVVKADPERVARGLGRAQLKLVSNVYLEKSLKEAA